MKLFRTQNHHATRRSHSQARRIKLLPLFAAVFMLITASYNSVALAIDRDFYSGNDIMFYDPKFKKGSTCKANGNNNDTSSGGSSAAASADQKQVATAIVDTFTGHGISTNGGKPLDFNQIMAIIGNIEQESTLNPGVVETAVGTGAFGLVQWTEPRKSKFFAFADGKGGQRTDPKIQMEYVIQELETTEAAVMPFFKQGLSLHDATLAWADKFERMGAAEAALPKRLANAEKWAETFKDRKDDINKKAEQQTTSSSTDGSDGASSPGGSKCSSDNAAISGDILATARQFAWPEEKPEYNSTSISAAKPAYQEAMKKHNELADVNITDCGRFVSTVMRASGVDKDFPPVTTTKQDEYVRAHPEKYEILEGRDVSYSDLKPGDILIWGPYQHIAFFNGESGKDDVDASYTQHVPYVSNNIQYFMNSGGPAGAPLHTVARVKKSGLTENK